MKKKEGKKPNIRFPEFNSFWEHRQLNELLSVSKIKNKDLKYNKSDVLSVSGELGVLNQIKHLGRSYAGASVHNYGVVETGDIVYTKSPLKTNPYGIIKLNKGESGIVSTLYAVYKVKKGVEGAFINHYFSLDANTNRYLRPLVRKGAKNDMKINNSYVLHDRIFVPEDSEQKRIADFFDVIDEQLSFLKAERKALKKYKRGAKKKLFSRKIRFTNSDGNDFPEWQEGKLSDFIEFLNGKAHEKIIVKEGGYKLVNSKFISSSGRSFKYAGEALLPLYKGDITMVMSDVPKGKALAKCFMVDADETYTLNQRICALKAKNIHEKFLFFQLNRNKYYLKFDSGVGQTNLKKRDVLNCPLVIPSFEEQKKIADFLTLLDEKIRLVELQISKTKLYKKGLLQQMFAV